MELETKLLIFRAFETAQVLLYPLFSPFPFPSPAKINTLISAFRIAFTANGKRQTANVRFAFMFS